MELDSWQKEVLETKGKTNIALRSARQCGKSTVISMLAGNYAVENPKSQILVVASVERQAYLLFDKTLSYLEDNFKMEIKKGKDRPTKHEIKLKNGSIIRSLPTGLDGHGIRGFTTNLLIVDEAAFIEDAVFDSVTPQLSVSGGKIVMLSTPFGRQGYFYRSFTDPSFKTWHVTATDCPRISKDFLEQEKKRMGKKQFLQEYCGEFVDELGQWFSSDLIRKCMVIHRFSDKNSETSPLFPVGDTYLGVDVAAKGRDQTVLISTCRVSDTKMRMFDIQITQDTKITDTISDIKAADARHKYNKIYIDSGGLGVGVSHPLLQDDQCKRKIVEINNSQRALDRDVTRKTKLMKEDLYVNCLRLMEQQRLALFDDVEIYNSLKSVQFEYDNGKLHIFGNDTHIAEALIRACYPMMEKQLGVWIK